MGAWWLGRGGQGRTGPSPEPLPLQDPQGVSSSWVFSLRMTDLSLVMHVKALEGQVAAAVASVVSDSVRPHGLQPSWLLRPWDFPGKNTGVGCHCLLQKAKLQITKGDC